jgi:hypothetical protein
VNASFPPRYHPNPKTEGSSTSDNAFLIPAENEISLLLAIAVAGIIVTDTPKITTNSDSKDIDDMRLGSTG